ncbi:solute carrier family 25 protein [archaeon]|nr:MAG: solute carrier family 25 protein [archaeon]
MAEAGTWSKMGIVCEGISLRMCMGRCQMLSSPYVLSSDASDSKSAAKVSSMYIDVLAGTLGGITVTIIGHPFDTTKTRLQTAPPGFYSGTMDCVKKTVHWEGFYGFYSGIVSPLSGKNPANLNDR